MPTRDQFNRLANEVRPRLIRQAVILSRDKELANDLVQVTLTKAAQHFDRFDGGERAFLNWTLRILQRSFLDEVRRRSRRVLEISFDGLPEGSDASFDALDMVCADIDILEDVIANDELAHIIETLKTLLPAEQVDALCMSILEGYSYEEVAALQNINVGTVRSRVHRAKKILTRVFQEQKLTSA